MNSQAPEAPLDDIPGVTRRHRLSDLYHERTNFQFIKHSKRWAILSGVLLVLSFVALFTRGLNFGIEFEGGTSWQVRMASGKSAHVSDVRDVLRPIGFSDAKVSILSGKNGQSVNVQERVISDPIQFIRESLATYGGRAAERRSVRAGPERRRRFVHVHREQARATVRGSRQPCPRADRAPRREREGRRPGRHDHGEDVAGEPDREGRDCAGRLRRRPERRREHLDRRSDMGTRGQPEGAQGADLLLHPARDLSLDPVRVQDGRLGDRGGDPRHHLHRRRLRALPLPGDARDDHRVPDHPRVLAVRHRRRVRQGPGEPTHAHRDRPHARTGRWSTGRSTRC